MVLLVLLDLVAHFAAMLTAFNSQLTSPLATFDQANKKLFDFFCIAL